MALDQTPAKFRGTFLVAVEELVLERVKRVVGAVGLAATLSPLRKGVNPTRFPAPLSMPYGLCWGLPLYIPCWSPLEVWPGCLAIYSMLESMRCLSTGAHALTLFNRALHSGRRGWSSTGVPLSGKFTPRRARILKLFETSSSKYFSFMTQIPFRDFLFSKQCC